MKTATTSTATNETPKRRGRPPLPAAEKAKRAAERKTKYRNPSKDQIAAKPGVVARMAMPLEGRMLGIHEVCARVNKSVSGVYTAIKSGEFPAPVKTGKRAVAWPGRAVAEHLAKLEGERANDNTPTSQAA